MRILILTTQDRFFLSHIKERAVFFKKKGCVVAVAAQKTSDEVVEDINKLGFVFYDTKIERQSLNLFSQFLALFRLFNINKDFKPDVSYHLGAKAIFYGTFVARLFNSKVGILNAPIGLGYVFASTAIKAKILKPIVKLLYNFFLNPRNSKVIVENIDDINYFVKRGYLNPNDAFCILGAGVDTQRFCPLPFNQRNDICTVVMASRLIKEKGVFDFVEAARKLYKLKVPVLMQIIGEPDYGNPSSISKEEFQKIRTDPSVECLGFKQDILPFLQKAHICCLPSYYREGLPRVLVEATSIGLALLTTDTIGCRESIREQNGFLFKPHDVDKLCDLIQYLVCHRLELEQMCQRSRSVAVTYFETEKISQRTYEVIKLLVPEHGRDPSITGQPL